MVVLDTNIIIEHLRLPGSEKSTLVKIVGKVTGEVLAVSVISIQELYEGKSTKDEKKEGALLATIAPLKILPYTYKVARLAGKIARDLERPIELADAAIAATTILNGGRLATLNKKDFLGIKGLEMVKIEAF